MYHNISEQLRVHRKISICVQNDSTAITESLLHADELTLISPMWSEKRKKTFVLGRLAAKQALATRGIETCPVLRGVMNEPVWPYSLKGSIAH